MSPTPAATAESQHSARFGELRDINYSPVSVDGKLPASFARVLLLKITGGRVNNLHLFKPVSQLLSDILTKAVYQISNRLSLLPRSMKDGVDLISKASPRAATLTVAAIGCDEDVRPDQPHGEAHR
jgi:hypothetical protein